MLGIVPTSASERVRTISNDYFEIAALDSRSLSYVNELSTFTAEIAGRYLEQKGMAYPQPILVTLRPQAYVNFSEDYRIRIGPRNTVELDIKWYEGLSLKSCCYALCEALLTQYSLFNYGSGGLSMLRAWPVTALTYEVYVGLRPATFSHIVNQALEQGAQELTTVLKLTYPNMSYLDNPYGYLALKAMKSQAINRRIMRGLFQLALSGEDISDVLLAELNTGRVEPIDLDTWWKEILESLVNSDYEVVETMTDSRLWLSEMAQFPDNIEIDTEKYSLNLRSIWEYRANSVVRTLLSARRDILWLRMQRINPAYYNSAYSLSKVFDSLLNNDESHKYLHSLTTYLSDWEDVKNMQKIIEDIKVHK
ncbi:MAG: hypothetical protein VXZ83_04425 [Verrucomicrobiota bacterium]|nr:hypothetical protein [Verrucomicrobiota bacterium]